MTELPKRKIIRLENYDYSTAGAYFLTLCVKDHNPILWASVGATCGRPPLSKIGKTVAHEIEKMDAVYPNVSVDKYCIMPNHIHMIIIISEPENGRSQNAPTIPRIMKQFKGSISKQLGFTIWQKSYIDRVIRNEKEYRAVWEYIDNNPIKLGSAE